MPRLAQGLNETQVRNAKPKEKPYKLSDGRGLTLLVNPDGSKWWRLRYILDGKEKMLSVGTYPDVSLSGAREKALELRKLVVAGDDPSLRRREAKQQLKASVRGAFKSVGEEWHAHKSKGWASETARKAREVLDDYLYPKIGSKAISELSSADVKPVLLYVHERGPRLAVKARQYVNQIVDYAIQEGLREDGKLLSLKGVLP